MGLNDGGVPRWGWREGMLAVVLIALTLIAYAPLRSCGFIDYDDPLYVTENGQVRAGLTARNLAWAFTTTDAANWHPLTWLSLMLDAQLFGSEPWGYHLTNLLFHLANTLLVFALFHRLTGAAYCSALTAALFAVHPLHVESVAWVSERKDVLSAFFGLLAMYAYARYVEAPSLLRYLPIVAAMVLSLLAKQMLVTLPFVLLLLDYWPLDRWASAGWRRLLGEKVPLFLLSAAMCLTTMLVQRQGGALKGLAHLSWSTRLGNALISYLQYLRQTVLPVDLALFYPHPTAELSAGTAIACGVVLIGLTLLVLAVRRRCPYLAVGWFWYLGMLVPVIGVVQVGLQARADRYTYLPLLGIFLLAAWGLADLANRWHFERALAVLAAGLVACLVLLAQVQVRFWSDPRALWEHTLQATGRNGVAHSHLGDLDLRQGKPERALLHYNEALRHSLDPASAHFNLASALLQQARVAEETLLHQGRATEANLLRQGKAQEAIAHLEECLRLNPRQPLAHELGAHASLRLGRWEEAIRHCHEAIAVTPDSARARFLLSKALMSQGRFHEAVPYLREAVRLEPNNGAIRSTLGETLMNQGDVAEAVAELSECVRQEPNFAAAHTNLAAALLLHGDLAESAEQFQQAIRLDAKNASARGGLGLVHQLRGQWAEAAAQYQRAADLQPWNAAHHSGLAYALHHLGQKDDARGEYQTSLQHDPNWPTAAVGKAWTLATNPKPSLRNGRWALQTLEQARQATGAEDEKTLDVLAAAYAECGRFSEAVTTARQARQRALAAGNKKLAAQIGERLNLYEKKQPFRTSEPRGVSPTRQRGI